MRITQSDIEKVLRAKAIVEKDYHKHYTYNELAQIAGTNVLKLQTVFQMVAQKNPYEYLIELRVEKAKEYLENTELTIEAIARKVGWDRSNLNKHFKELNGQSPRAWRSAQNSNNGMQYENKYNSMAYPKNNKPPHLNNKPPQIAL